MIERTMRCRSPGCRAKVRVQLSSQQLHDFDNAMAFGVQRGEWKFYRVLRDELGVECFACERAREEAGLPA